MSDAADGPAAAVQPPVDAWATVTIDGDRVTRVEVGAGETLEVHLDVRNEADPDD